MERVKSFLILVLEKLVGVLLMIMSAVTLAQVFCRYALGFSLTWSHELVVLALIWTVWLSIPIGLDRMEHLSVTFFADHNSYWGKFRLAWLHVGLATFFFVLVFLLSFPVVEAFEGMDLMSIPVPINIRYYAAMVGSLVGVFVLVAKLLELFKEG